MSGQIFKDGFPVDPQSAVGASYFLSDSEKQEWGEWLQTATAEQKQELVEILHSMWIENEKQSGSSEPVYNQNNQSQEAETALPEATAFQNPYPADTTPQPVGNSLPPQDFNQNQFNPNPQQSFSIPQNYQNYPTTPNFDPQANFSIPQNIPPEPFLNQQNFQNPYPADTTPQPVGNSLPPQDFNQNQFNPNPQQSFSIPQNYQNYPTTPNFDPQANFSIPQNIPPEPSNSGPTIIDPNIGISTPIIAEKIEPLEPANSKTFVDVPEQPKADVKILEPEIIKEPEQFPILEEPKTIEEPPQPKAEPEPNTEKKEVLPVNFEVNLEDTNIQDSPKNYNQNNQNKNQNKQFNKNKNKNKKSNQNNQKKPEPDNNINNNQEEEEVDYSKSLSQQTVEYSPSPLLQKKFDEDVAKKDPSQVFSLSQAKKAYEESDISDLYDQYVQKKEDTHVTQREILDLQDKLLQRAIGVIIKFENWSEFGENILDKIVTANKALSKIETRLGSVEQYLYPSGNQNIQDIVDILKDDVRNLKDNFSSYRASQAMKLKNIEDQKNPGVLQNGGIFEELELIRLRLLKLEDTVQGNLQNRQNQSMNTEFRNNNLNIPNPKPPSNTVDLRNIV
jgi:hypothetical protein